MTHITSIAQLRALYDPVRERSAKKEIPELDAHCQAFVARSPLVVVATHSVAVTAQADTAPLLSPGTEPGSTSLKPRH